jgi:hypothetical protein
MGSAGAMRDAQALQAFLALRLGRKADALEAAVTAVKLGGPLAATFQKTLDEIRSSP